MKVRCIICNKIQNTETLYSDIEKVCFICDSTIYALLPQVHNSTKSMWVIARRTDNGLCGRALYKIIDQTFFYYHVKSTSGYTAWKAKKLFWEVEEVTGIEKDQIMKVKCIKYEGHGLTVGKEYTLVYESNTDYHIIDDNGVGSGYYKLYFEKAGEKMKTQQITMDNLAEVLEFNGVDPKKYRIFSWGVYMDRGHNCTNFYDFNNPKWLEQVEVELGYTLKPLPEFNFINYLLINGLQPVGTGGSISNLEDIYFNNGNVISFRNKRFKMNKENSDKLIAAVRILEGLK